MKEIEYIVMIVGVGGTGGNFAKEFARYWSFFKRSGYSIKSILIDGDKVEEKNGERQPFIQDEIEQMKAITLATAINDTFMNVRMESYLQYIDTVEQLQQIYMELATYSVVDMANNKCSIPVVIGCVDNHRARQCMHEFFEKQDTIFYIDSANEYIDGEVVFSAKLNGFLVAPARSYYYPDVLEDTSPRASEMSCGVINEGTPQHLVTNLQAANIILSGIVSLFSEDKFKGGIAYFNRSEIFLRFQPYVRRVDDEKS